MSKLPSSPQWEERGGSSRGAVPEPPLPPEGERAPAVSAQERAVPVGPWRPVTGRSWLPGESEPAG
jgi:hypothetical protein